VLVINQLKVKIDANISDFKDVLVNKLRIGKDNILKYTILKKSIDSRKKDDILFVYNVIVRVKNEEMVLRKKLANVEKYVIKNEKIDYSKFRFDKNKKVAVIGFGPAGMFSALTFAQAGINVSVFERGEEVDKRIKSVDKFTADRILNTESNIQFGEGGAGTFSDGKLTARKKDARGKWLFRELVRAGAPEEILYIQNPHIGTDKLINVVKNIRKEIIKLGSTINFDSKVSNIIPFENGINITVNNADIYFDYVVLAMGHSSRDTIEMLYNNKCDITQKPFAVGFRIEHQQAKINKAQFGVNFDNPLLGAAEYKLTHQTKNKRGVYTFCMCPGGIVVPATSEEGMVVVNGMSEYSRDKVNANSALLVTVDEKDFKSDHPLAGIEFQRDLERKAYALGGSNYNAPVQKVGDYLRNVKTTELGKVLPSYGVGVTYSNLRSVFSKEINEALTEAIVKLGNKLKGFSDADALLTGVESRSSSPIRVVRDNVTLQSTNFKNLYPTGEGAGYAGGIVSAAIDGIKVTEKVLDLLKL